MNTLYDVQNTSNNKIRFSMEFQGGSNTTLIGDSSGGQGRTTVMFIRLGDTWLILNVIAEKTSAIVSRCPHYQRKPKSVYL